MGLFDKKFCDICGEKISFLGNRKLDDGNMCSKCAKQISPFFEDRRHTSLDEMKEHLSYREQNKAKLSSFNTSESYGDSQKVYVDRAQGCFVVTYHAPGSWEKENPDIIPLSEVSSCNLDIRENRREEFTKDAQGNSVSYNPPRYSYEYDFYIDINLSSRWFSHINIKLNTFDVNGMNSHKYHEYQIIGQQIVSALTGTPISFSTGTGFGYSNPYAHGTGTGAIAGMAGAFVNQVIQNGQQQMQQQAGGAAPRKIKCTNCGFEIEVTATPPKFCPSCGDPIDSNDLTL